MVNTYFLLRLLCWLTLTLHISDFVNRQTMFSVSTMAPRRRRTHVSLDWQYAEETELSPPPPPPPTNIYDSRTLSKRKAPSIFDWQRALEEGEQHPNPDIRIKHTRFDLEESGASSSRTTYISAPASPTKSAPPVYDDFTWNDEPPPLELNIANYPFLDPAYQHFLDINEPGPPRRKRTTEDDPLRKWRDNDRDRYLHELIYLDGRGEADVAAACGLCNAPEPKLRCKDCFGGLMFCTKCMIDLHACNPLHRLEVYTFYYQRLYTDRWLDFSAGTVHFSDVLH